jgi:hypothetical protein
MLDCKIPLSLEGIEHANNDEVNLLDRALSRINLHAKIQRKIITPESLQKFREYLQTENRKLASENKMNLMLESLIINLNHTDPKCAVSNTTVASSVRNDELSKIIRRGLKLIN